MQKNSLCSPSHTHVRMDFNVGFSLSHLLSFLFEKLKIFIFLSAILFFNYPSKEHLKNYISVDLELFPFSRFSELNGVVLNYNVVFLSSHTAVVSQKLNLCEKEARNPEYIGNANFSSRSFMQTISKKSFCIFHSIQFSDEI